MTTEAVGAAAPPPIRTAYFIRIPNVGDRINRLLVEALTGRAAKHVANCADPHLLAVGSLISQATAASCVWGSGLVHPSAGVGGLRGENVRALRGPLTWKVLRSQGVALPDVPLGDPALLAPGLLNIRKSARPSDRVGVVPHYVDRQRPSFRRLREHPLAVDLNVHDDPARFLRLMAGCRVVISSSLHGLVFAEALGIPSLWVNDSNEVIGDGFKFQDWFGTTHNPQSRARDLLPTDQLEELAAGAERHPIAVDLPALDTAFPRDRLGEFESARSLRVERSASHGVLPVFVVAFEGDRLDPLIQALRARWPGADVVVQNMAASGASRLTEAGLAPGHPIANSDLETALNRSIRSYFETWDEPSRYVVTESDLAPDDLASFDLDSYDSLLNAVRTADSAGPLLPGHPTSEPERAIGLQLASQRGGPPRPLTVFRAPGDATFALHRGGEPFTQGLPALRVSVSH